MEVDIDIDDIVFSCSPLEKYSLYKALREDGDVLSRKEKEELEKEERRKSEFFLMQELGAMRPFELKKLLCNLLCVGSYTDEEALREKLEKVITAR